MHADRRRHRRPNPASRVAPTVRAWVASCVAIASLALDASATEPTRARPTEDEDRAPSWGLATGPIAAEAPTRVEPSDAFPETTSGSAGCADGQCRDLVFARPGRCQLHKRTPERKFMQCGTEARRLVTVGPTGIVAVKALPDVPARNPYPLELVAQWRYCPFAPDPVLEAALVPYEDPDIGRCYLLRPREPDGVTTRGLRIESLSTLHPYLADAIERLLVLARARGDEFRVISTIRAAKKVTKTTTRKVKVRGRWKTESSTTTRYQGGGWHAFGLAVDINIEGRKDLGSATAAFLRGGPERAAWLRLGAQAESFGLIWLGRSDPNEIFHFEWHPGWPGMPKGALYQSLAQEADERGIPSIWRRLAFDGGRKSPFRHLRDERVPLPASATRGLPNAEIFEEPTKPKAPKKATRKRRPGGAKAPKAEAVAAPSTAEGSTESPDGKPDSGKRSAGKRKTGKAKSGKGDSAKEASPGGGGAAPVRDKKAEAKAKKAEAKAKKAEAKAKKAEAKAKKAEERARKAEEKRAKKRAAAEGKTKKAAGESAKETKDTTPKAEKDAEKQPPSPKKPKPRKRR